MKKPLPDTEDKMSGEEAILGYRVSVRSKTDCVSEIAEWVKDGKKNKYFVCANPHSIEVARRDPAFDAAIRNADLFVPDGIGIVIASRLLGGSIRERVTGMDIFLGLSEALNRTGGRRYFFLGSSDGNLKKIEEKMKKD